MNGLKTLLRKSLWSGMNLRQEAGKESLLKVLFIAGFLFGLMGGLLALFYNGFSFIDRLGGGLMIVQRLFAIFFFGLGALLILSSAIAAYTTIYRSEEMPFLQRMPLRMEDILYYKLLETSALSLWAFFIIIIPFVTAYAAYQQLGIWFVVWTLLFSFPFVLLNAAIGCILTCVLIRYYPGGRAGWLLPFFLLLLGVWGVTQLRASGVSSAVSAELMLTQIVPGIQFASHPLWPSTWVAEGILALSRGYIGRGVTFWVLLFSTMLVLSMVFESIGVRLFFAGWQRTLVSRSRASAEAVSWIRLNRLLGILPADLRGIVIKDIRIFTRDAAQWSQGVIFFGLLTVYFVNLRNLHYHELEVVWRNLISFLNIFGVSAVMCSFGTRFIYPQPSLEGQGFWLVGMSPTTMGRVLAAKFALAWGTLACVSLTLMGLSAAMLRLPGELTTVALVIAFSISLGVAGMSTGLGAVFLDLRQRNPAAIISGFGGTLNLILSLALMLFSIVPFGMLFHLAYLGHLSDLRFAQLRWAGMGVLLLLSTLMAGVPLLLGRRSLLAREY